MTKKRKLDLLKLLCISIISALVGCGEDMSDIDAYMKEKRSQATRPIEPIPTMPQYDVFIYGVAGKRSPFEKPRDIQDMMHTSHVSAVKPDELRAKEYLEQFNLSSIVMVGTITVGGVKWGLVDDGTGNIQRVRVGNFIGRNYGKIYQIDDNRIDLKEIVPSGSAGWVERQKTLRMSETPEK